MAFPTIETIQDQKGISHWLQHLRWGKEISEDFKIALSAAQLALGLTTPLLNDVELNFPYLNEGVMSHLRTTLKKLNGNLHIEGVWVPSLQRQRDRSIMKMIARIHDIKVGDL